MPDPVHEKIASILTTTLDIAPEKLRPEADLRHDLGLDSFAAVELSFALDEAYGIKVADDDMASVKTVADLVEAVRKRLQGPAQAPATQ